MEYLHQKTAYCHTLPTLKCLWWMVDHCFCSYHHFVCVNVCSPLSWSLHRVPWVAVTNQALFTQSVWSCPLLCSSTLSLLILYSVEGLSRIGLLFFMPVGISSWARKHRYDYTCSHTFYLNIDILWFCMEAQKSPNSFRNRRTFFLMFDDRSSILGDPY